MCRTLMVLVSGAGTTLQNLCQAIEEKRLNAKISIVISNHSNVGAADIARSYKLPYFVLDPKIYPTADKWDEVFLDFVSVYKPSMVICAGFDKKVPVPNNYKGRIVNIHPSLLPKYGGKGFYGDRVHKAVLNSSEQTTGCTVHVVNEEYDKGRILAQEKVPVLAEDSVETLRERVKVAERRLYPMIIEGCLNDIESKIS